jgi:hypothetical protein
MLGIPARNQAHYDAIKAAIERLTPDGYLVLKQAYGVCGLVEDERARQAQDGLLRLMGEKGDFGCPDGENRMIWIDTGI